MEETMKKVRLTSAGFTFIARLEEEKSPETCKWLLNLMPWTIDMRHVSWSGNACFARLQDLAWGLPYEENTHIPSKGEIIVYPGNVPSLQMGGEFFLAWGPCHIRTMNGRLSGNIVLTIIEGNENLKEYGEYVHLKGMQKMLVELAED